MTRLRSLLQAAAASVLVAAACSRGIAQATTAHITLAVDLTDAPRRILHATEIIPVSQTGALTLVYPKWIPGEHGPTGPIENLAGLIISADGTRLKWERDAVDMFALHLNVPAGAQQLEIKLDFLATDAAVGFSAGASTSANLALLSWNTVVLYPEGAKAADVLISPSLTLPPGWKYGTALVSTAGAQTPVSETAQPAFNIVSLETLVDSPVLAGRWFKEIPLAPDVSPRHFLDMAADGPEDLELSPEHLKDFSKLVLETGALYKSRHFNSYHFLVTLSDQVAHFGLEHHQSSDDRVPEKTFTDDRSFIVQGDLLPHEFTHSWNGKYRRPAGLSTPNYQVPMVGDLLWVYEGLTQYLGDVLAVRSGIWSAEQYRGYLADSAATLNQRPGRTWRDLQDTATAAQILYSAGGGWDNWRRITDYYAEGELLWLDVDTTIREMTHGKRSLNDFVASFHGLNGNTPPTVVPYTFNDVVRGLNAVAPNDWASFLRERLDTNRPEAPLGGVTRGGYDLLFGENPNIYSYNVDELSDSFDFWYSAGLDVTKSGTVTDVLVGGPADKAAIGPSMRIVAVNGRTFNPDLLRQALRAAKGSGPAAELILENTGYYKVVELDYHGGERFPYLERNASANRLDDILKPMTK